MDGCGCRNFNKGSVHIMVCRDEFLFMFAISGSDIFEKNNEYLFLGMK